MAKASQKLSAKEKRFVEEYLIDLDPKRAALAAGFAASTAGSKAYQWVSDSKVKPHVFAAILKAQGKRSERTEITQDAVLKELAKIGFANIGDMLRVTPDGDPFLDLSDLTPEQTAALSEVTVEDYMEGRGENAREVRRVKVKLWDKRAALVDMGKHLGMFKNLHEHTGKNGGPIETVSREMTAKEAADAYARTLAADGDPE